MGAPIHVTVVLTADLDRTIGSGELPRATTAAVERLETLFDDALRRHAGTRSPVGHDEHFVACFHRAQDALALALDVQFAVVADASAQEAMPATRGPVTRIPNV